ncbi:MAG: ABC transporter substrate-binding protein [Proteobacteria bacterium]|jgi:ABC-type branched-subunit amino acid transport system substrate-binding protein|nr:ABC transporter substrate-binding protein [Pseudomonadota bacterium]
MNQAAISRLLVACGAALAAATVLAAEPIRIGISITQSPPGSVVQGTQVKDGVEIVKDMVNKAGGVLGRPIELVYEDDQGIPEKGRAAAEKLITVDKVVAITGAHQSSVCLAAIEVAKRYNIPYVNTNCWADAVRTKGYANVFSAPIYSSRVAESVAETLGKLGAKNIVAFAENTDYGIGQAKAIGAALAKMPGVTYRYETLDRAGKDFTPAILPLRANPPDAVLMAMLPPPAYTVINELYEQGVAPTAKTWLYDTSGLADYPDFWQNVKQGAVDMLNFALYHPAMKQPPLAAEVAEAYKQRTKNNPNRLIFQAADSLLFIVDAIKEAKSTDPAAMIAAMEKMKFTGTRGTFTISSTPGPTYHQMMDVPTVTYQITAVNQPIGQTTLLEGPGMPLDLAKLKRPAK